MNRFYIHWRTGELTVCDTMLWLWHCIALSRVAVFFFVGTETAANDDDDDDDYMINTLFVVESAFFL